MKQRPLQTEFVCKNKTAPSLNRILILSKQHPCPQHTQRNPNSLYSVQSWWDNALSKKQVFLPNLTIIFCCWKLTFMF